MHNATPANSATKITSISNRFNIALIGIIAVLMIAFASAVIFLNLKRIDTQVATRLDNAVEFAQNSLSTPLWNLDTIVVNDFVDALFLDESIVYIRISGEHKVLIEKKRAGFKMTLSASGDPSPLPKRSEYVSRESDMLFGQNNIGTILVVMSREKLRKQAYQQVQAIIVFTVLIVAAIYFTSIFVTRRYITSPLSRLQETASAIAHGELDTVVDKSGRDEIGILARHLDHMRGSLKRLFVELKRSKEQVEEHSRTLEQKVSLRTRELAQSVEELQALGEVVQAVNSTLDLESVLTRIVRHAVQLSHTDAGTIYEFDEEKQVFVPRINFGSRDEFVDAIRRLTLKQGDGSVIGQASARKTPVQIPDIRNEVNYPVPFIQKEGYLALLAVPLLRQDRLIGGLIVRRKIAGAFPERVVNLLQTLAAQSVMAIHNARLFREIEVKSRELAIANRHKSEFLANMSHELRTPLNAILGYTELIVDNIYGDVPQKIQDVLERVEKNGRHLLGLINDVLDLSKIEAGRLTLSLDTYSMKEVILTALSAVEALAAEKSLELTADITDPLANGTGDVQRISQVVLNLLGNALKFTDQGKVTVAASTVDETFLVSVSDTGPGLEAEDQKNIFKEFHQADGSHTREKGGTGLGLSISKKIVEMHGGRIGVDSTPGKGSTFWFSLPVHVDKQMELS